MAKAIVSFTIVFVFGWIILATAGPLRHSDPYPFPFLLFLGRPQLVRAGPAREAVRPC